MAVPLRHPLGGGRSALGPPGNRLTTQALRQGVPGAASGSVVQRAALFGSALAPITATGGGTLAGATLAATAIVYEIITATGGGTLAGATLAATATVATPAPAPAGLVRVPAAPAAMWTAWDG